MSEPSGGKSPTFGQGFRWEGDDPRLLLKAIDAAFDYRGDVTLLLRDGEELQGYVFNRNATAARPFLQIFPANGTGSRNVLYQDLRGIAFSGRDPASGKSWEAWLKKYQARKEAQAEEQSTAEEPEAFGLYPEALDS